MYERQPAESELLLSALHQAQAQDGYITQAAIAEIAARLGFSSAAVYETASFYSMLYLQPQGRHIIAMCQSAPCHVAGAGAVVSALEQALGISMGETTPDGRITLQYVQCLGQCQSSPALMVDGTPHSPVTPGQIPALLQTLK